jgi:alkylation response protein AidB-like acyl-CoA dehydrogenase
MSATATRDALREVARDVLSGPQGGDAAVLARTMARLDWYALLVDPRLGGVGAGLGPAVTLVEELASAGAITGYLHDGILAPVMLAHLPDTPAVRELARGLAAGQRHVCVVLAAAVGERHAPQLAVGPGGLAVTGRSGPLETGDDADLVLALARDGAAHQLVMLPAGGPGVLIEPATDVAGRPLRRVVLTAAPVAGQDRFAVGDDEREQLISAAAVAATARMVGAATRCLTLTLQHVRARTQFGRRLADFQAVQMRCADLAQDVDSSRCILYRAVEAFDAGSPERHLLASMAKAWAGETCTRATQTAHLLHGALGFTAEYELHRHSALVLADRLGFGSVQFHRARIARYLTTTSRDWSIG